MTDKDLAALAKNVAQARLSEAALRSQLKVRQERYEKTTSKLREQVKKSESLTLEQEAAFRAALIEVYNEKHIKKLTGGGIRVGREPVYTVQQALSWSIEHRVCLSLNTKAFEKLADSEALPFVDWQEKVSATIDSDLTPFLEKEKEKV